MASIFHEDGEQSTCHGSKGWERTECPTTTSEIRGRFFEELNGEAQSPKDYFLSGESLFYQEGPKFFRLELIFTVVEEKLYLRNHKSTERRPFRDLCHSILA